MDLPLPLTVVSLLLPVCLSGSLADACFSVALSLACPVSYLLFFSLSLCLCSLLCVVPVAAWLLELLSVNEKLVDSVSTLKGVVCERKK